MKRALGAMAVVLAGAALWTAAGRLSTPLDLAEDILLRAALLGLVAALRFVPPNEDDPATSKRTRLALALLVGASLGLRLVPPILPWHAFGWFEYYAQRLGDLWGLRWYGNGFFVLADAALLFGVGVEEAIAGVNVAAAVASVAAVGWAGTRWLGDRRVGLLAAALLAVQPLHVALAPSDSMQYLPGLMPVLAFGGALVFTRTGHAAGLLVTACASVFGALSRPEGFLALVAPALVLVSAEGRPRLRRPLPWVAAGATLLAVTPFLTRGLWAKFNGPAPNSHFVVSPLYAAWNAWEAWTSVGAHLAAFALLGLLGPLWAFFRTRRLELLAPLAAWLVIAQVGGFDVNFANRWQILLPQLPWMALGAAVALVTAWDLHEARFPGRWRRAAALAVVAGLAFAVDGLRAAPLTQRWDQQEEWRFVHERLDLLDSVTPAAPLVLARPEADGPYTAFPTYLLPRGSLVLPRAALAKRMAPTGSLYYRGLSCWNYPQVVITALPDKVEACAKAEAEAVLEPVDVRRVDAPSFVGHRTAGAQVVEIGFFRVTGWRE